MTDGSPVERSRDDADENSGDPQAEDSDDVTTGEETAPTTACGHEAAVGYEVGFVVQDDVEEIDSACVMRATVQRTDPDDPAADAVGCVVENCDGYHETVAADLRRDAARHSGNVSGNGPSC